MAGPTTYHTLAIASGVEIFYRAAGAENAPVLLLLHGYPSSSHQFRNLIPLLADQFRVIAPDLPGFGSSVAPKRGEYDYTFDNLANAIDSFTEAIGRSNNRVSTHDLAGLPFAHMYALAW